MDGATNLRCRSHGVLDETFQVTFRMPRADLCVGVMRDRMDRSNTGATDIALTARHADDGTTLVSFDAG
ncbi:hypothetical protein [Streptomyces erythrochromogenes]|uniref:hypothetical protein n=1 Tax=Streptomyces erythrochromogenes TaxID=285574 RepID=UPI0036A5B03F